MTANFVWKDQINFEKDLLVSHSNQDKTVKQGKRHIDWWNRIENQERECQIWPADS